MQPFEYPRHHPDSRSLFVRLVDGRCPRKQAAIRQYQREKRAMDELRRLQQANRARQILARRLNIGFTCLIAVGTLLVLGSFA